MRKSTETLKNQERTKNGKANLAWILSWLLLQCLRIGDTCFELY